MPMLNSRSGGVVLTICCRKSAHDLFCFAFRSYIFVTEWISDVHFSTRLKNGYALLIHPVISMGHPANPGMLAYLFGRDEQSAFCAMRLQAY